MSSIDLTPIIKDYQNKWVALSDDETAIYGAGDTAKEAVRDAESKGHLDYILFFVRPFDLLYCGDGISGSV